MANDLAKGHRPNRTDSLVASQLAETLSYNTHSFMLMILLELGHRLLLDSKVPIPAHSVLLLQPCSIIHASAYC